MALTKVTGSVIKDSVSLSGNVSVGGTLTYQDVTNVDALGIGTFRTGIKVLAGQVDVGSNIKIGNAGVITATSFVGSGVNLTNVNANTLDSIDSLSFLRSDANDTATGTITFSSTGVTYGPIITSNNAAGPKLSINATGSGGKHWMWISNSTSNTDGSGYLQAWNSTDSFSPVTFGYDSDIETNFRTGVEVDGNLKLGTANISSPYTSFKRISINNNLILL